MDIFANMVKHRESAPRKIKVHKTYINEDPNVEEVTTCPKCWSRNQQSTVRYMYINMNEAIYKCEDASCMYPFRNFKYKNYTDNTVYYYNSTMEEEGRSAAVTQGLDEFTPSFLDCSSPLKSQPSPAKGCNTSLFDFNLECFSPEKVSSGSPVTLGDIKTPDRNIFDSPSIRNLVKDFDTGFIDDILQELGGAGSPEKKLSPIARVSHPKPVPNNRQLKRCLEMFQKAKGDETQGVFKVPPLPGTEPVISPKHKARKSPGHHKRHKHMRRHHHSPSSGTVVPLSAGQMLQKSRMKPLQFIESLNSVKPSEGKETAPAMTGIQRIGNQKVERMLSFIERSMKKREPSPAPSSSNVEPTSAQPTKRAVNQFMVKRREQKRLSLSAAVLHDTQFRYESTEQHPPLENDPVAVPINLPPPPKEVIVPSMESQSLQPKPPNTVLPSFDELLDFIHPPDPADPRWKNSMC